MAISREIRRCIGQLIIDIAGLMPGNQSVLDLGAQIELEKVEAWNAGYEMGLRAPHERKTGEGR